MGRIKELDGLRAIAVLGVLAAHFVPLNAGVANVFGLGRFGVDLFFVISGFLITRILIGLRHEEAPLGAFYSRRTLRIFPPYYLALAFILLLALAHRERINYREVARHALFLSSLTPSLIRVAISRLLRYIPPAFQAGYNQAPYSLLQFKDCLGIYWSLSVEELFYLIWAPIILKGSRRTVLFCSLAPFFVCPLLRGLAHTTPHMAESIGFVFRFDSLAAGGCLALLFWGVENDYVEATIVGRALKWAMALSSLALLSLITFCGVWRGIDVRTTLSFSVFGFSFLAILCASVVGACARWSGGQGFPSSLLRSKSMVYLGMISYTVYLIHLPAYVVVQHAMSRFFGWNVFAAHQGLIALSGVLATVVTIGLAGLSWNYIEAPILRLKNKLFPMHDAGLRTLAQSEMGRFGRQAGRPPADQISEDTGTTPGVDTKQPPPQKGADLGLTGVLKHH
jgi:peptidoglycan/LPS O-acetylase OafA/YrhL